MTTMNTLNKNVLHQICIYKVTLNRNNENKRSKLKLNLKEIDKKVKVKK